MTRGTDADRTGTCYHESLKAAITRFLPCRLFAQQLGSERWCERYIAIVMVLISWSCAATLSDRFEQSRRSLAQMFAGRKRPGKTYQGLIEAVLHRGQALLEKVKRHLQAQVSQVACEHWRFKGRFVPIGADGSKVECPKTAGNELAFGCAGKNRSVPQQFLTTLIHLTTGLVWDFVVGSGLSSERDHLLQMLANLPVDALIVADAGFTGFAFLRWIMLSGRHVLIRAGSNVRLLRKLGFAIEERGSTVYLWPQEHQQDHPPLVLRLIVLTDGRNRQMHLLSSVLDKQQLSEAEVSQLYTMRWGVELYYRALKQTLRRRKLCGGSPLVARAELNWSMIGLWLLTLMGSGAILRSGGPPGCLSVARALRLLRHATRRPTRRAGTAGLERQLCQARLDCYTRQRSKAARDWAHRKKTLPPGTPRARMATATEVARAQSFTIRRDAA